jgi:hypothetical protein
MVTFRNRTRCLALLVAGVLGCVTLGCTAVRDDLARAEKSYDDARYEDTLVWLEALEREAPSMPADMRVRYFYLRGMTAYRLEETADALHYLALTREMLDDRRGALRPRQRRTMDRALRDLSPETTGDESPSPAG